MHSSTGDKEDSNGLESGRSIEIITPSDNKTKIQTGIDFPIIG
jgi:hypothetical protein